MPRCCGQDFDRAFDAKEAKKQLSTYRRKGPRGPTRKLLRALDSQSADVSSLLDIGGGAGVLQHELAARGALKVWSVEASAAYAEAATEEAHQRGYVDRREVVLGDFVDVAEDVPSADLVTLDKVICCYPQMIELVSSSARKAQRLYGIVVPRDGGWVRLVGAVGNLVMRYLLRWQFRSYVHRHRDIDACVAAEGLQLVHAEAGLFWAVRLYRR